ncbi:MAG: MFS transporter [Armatimonadetes bacterium]|nr:MFS transporter [Armatimonadota bacterium]
MDPTLEEQAYAERTYAKVSRRLLPFLFLCYILAYLDRVNLGFAKLQMLGDLKFSDATFATGAGLFFVGYFFFEVPSNLLLQRFGARRWIARIMVSWGVLSAAMMFTRSVPTFYALRLLLGLAEAGFFPGIVFYLSTWYPARMRARRTASFMAAIAVAGIIGNPLSGALMDSLSGVWGLAGWQWLFLVEGLPSVLVGIWVLSYLDSSIAEAKWLTADEKALLTANIAAEDAGKDHARVADAFADIRVWVLCFVYFCLMVGLYAVTFWLPTLVTALVGKGYLKVGLVSAIPYMAAVAAMFAVGRHSDRTGERRLHAAGSFVVAGIGLLLIGFTGDKQPILSMICLSLAAAGILTAMPLFWTLPTGFLASSAAAAGIGLINSFGNLGGYVGPKIPIWAKAAHIEPMLVVSVSLFVGSLVLAVLVKPGRAAQASS